MAPGIGTTGEGESNVNSITPTVLTTTVNGAWVFGCGTDWQALGNGTSTDVSEAATPTDLSILAVRESAATPTAGTGVTLNFDAAGTGAPDWTWAALEIVPTAGGALAVDAGSPALASSVDDPWATGSFTAPEDSLLVVCVMGDDYNGTGSTNPTITPTSSGLSFTERVRRYGGETTGSPDVQFGLAAIFTAPVTAGQGVSRTVSVTTSNTFDAGGVKVYVVTESSVSSAPAPPTYVADRGSIANATAATTSVVTVTSPTSIAVGNYLIARVAVDNSGTNGAAPGCTVTDTRNTWTVLGPALADPGTASAGSTAYLCYAEVNTAYQAADTLTFNWGGISTTAKAIVVEEWTQIHRGSPVAVAAVTNDSGAAASTTAVAATIVPTAPNQLVYTCLATEGIAGDSITYDSDTTNGSWSSGLTRVASANATATNNQCVAGQYKIVSAGGSQTWNATITSRDWAAIAVVFAPLPFRAPDPRIRRLLPLLVR
jgi:hypothetical protein